MEDLIEKLKSTYSFGLPVSSYELANFEIDLGLSLPERLKAILEETNGIEGEYGTKIFWSTEEILQNNLNLRSNEDFKDLYMPFDSLLFFAEEANSDFYGFVIVNGEITRDDIFIWDHETDSRSWFASNLESYLLKRLEESDLV